MKAHYFYIILFIVSTVLSADVREHVLSNGLTLLIQHVESSQPIAIKLFYKVGSKHETINEKGIAHLLEHMVFKGTTTLSETDIPVACQMLATEFNAATSHDWTVFYFNTPIQHWRHMFTILADCMSNCTFKPDLLNAELHVVIQELKMYKDHYTRTLLEKLDKAIFVDHPYHYPVIGFKHDLYHMTHDNLMKFYKKYYHPNNAVLVVVGNVDPDEVILQAEKCFGNIPADETCTMQTFTNSSQTYTNTIELHRAVSQPSIMLAWTIPGQTEQQQYSWNVLAHYLVNSQNSTIQKELVDTQKLVYGIGAGLLMRFDSGYFIVEFEPKEVSQVPEIIDFITSEIQKVGIEGVDLKELKKINRASRSAHYNLMQNNNAQASMIGNGYLARNDKDVLSHYIIDDVNELNELIIDHVNNHLQVDKVNAGYLLVSNEEQTREWNNAQHESDKEDAQFLSDKYRTSELEQPLWASTLEISDSITTNPVIPETYTLANGIEVLQYVTTTIPKITLKLQLKASCMHDPLNKEGLSAMTHHCMFEGTKHHPGLSFVQTCEDHAINILLHNQTITVSCLKEDIQKALTMLCELLTECTFEEDAIEKIRDQLICHYLQLWDDPHKIAEQLVDKYIFKNHPFERSAIGNPDSLSTITRDEIVDFYTKFITPDGAKLSIVGDIASEEIQQLLNDTIGSWTGSTIDDIEYPELDEVEPTTIFYPLDRDQTVLFYAGRSVNLFHENYYALTIFDAILAKRLFQLREQYGIFYTMHGASVCNESEEPGICFISTIVSNDKIQEVKSIIETALQAIPSSLTEDELKYAKSALLETPSHLYKDNATTAGTFLFLNKHKFPFDYVAYLKSKIEAVTLNQVQQAASSILDLNKMIIIQVGRAISDNHEPDLN
jgi:zinc protease